MKYLMIMIVLLIMTGCVLEEKRVDRIELKADKYLLDSKNGESATLSAKVKNSKGDILDGFEVKYYLGEVLLENSLFKPIKEGKYELKAQIGNKWSNSITINVIYNDKDEYKYVSKFGAKLNELERQFCYPSDIESDNEENIYVSDTYSDRIQIFDKSGNFIRTIGENNSEFQINDLTIDTKNNQVVYLDNKNHKIEKYDFYGIKAKTFDVNNIVKLTSYNYNGFSDFICTDGSMIDIYGNSFSKGTSLELDYNASVDSIRVATKGCIYIVDTKNATIIRAKAYAMEKRLGKRGENSGELTSPTDIDVDSGGYIYIADSKRKVIQRFTYEMEFMYEFGNNINKDISKIKVVDDIIYALDKGANVVRKYISSGDSIGVLGNLPIEGQFRNPKYITVDSKENIYITDDFAVRVFDKYGKYLAKMGKDLLGTENDYFSQPSGVVVDSKNNVYVSDEDVDNKIAVYDDKKIFVKNITIKDSVSGKKINCYRMKIDNNDHIYVACGNSVYKIDTMGNVFMKIDVPIVGEHLFTDMALDSKENIYICDSKAKNILIYDKNGKFVKILQNSVDLIYPKGVAVDQHDNSYVLDYSASVLYKFNIDGELLTKYGKEGKDDNSFMKPTSFWVSSNGNNIYVVDNGNGRIKKLEN